MKLTVALWLKSLDRLRPYPLLPQVPARPVGERHSDHGRSEAERKELGGEVEDFGYQPAEGKQRVFESINRLLHQGPDRSKWLRGLQADKSRAGLQGRAVSVIF